MEICEKSLVENNDVGFKEATVSFSRNFQQSEREKIFIKPSKPALTEMYEVDGWRGGGVVDLSFTSL